MNKQSILPVDERNKALGIVTINDVEEQFEQLLEYEKSDFIKSHLNCVVEEDEDDDPYFEHSDNYNFDEVWEFVRDHDDDELLDEIGDDSAFAYLARYWNLGDFISELKANGKRIGQGYTDDEFVSKLNLVNLNKDTQLNILKQLDDNVIREFLQK